MLTVRRIYLYLVSAISLVAVSWAVIGLVRLILSEGIGRGQITGLASLLAVIIVGLPIYLFHWLMAQRLAAHNREEQESFIRQIYFYLIMAAGAAPIAANIYRLVDNGLVALVGGIRPNYYPYDLTTAEHVAALLIWAVVWVYHWRLARPLSDRQNPSTLVLNLSIRRLYLLAFALAGLVALTWGVIGLLQTLMQSATLVIWQTPVANYSAQLLIGLALWGGHWLILQQEFFSGHPVEERSTLRKVYLYLAVFAYSVMALSSGALLLKRFIELALGAPPSPEPLLSQLSLVAPMLLVGALFWAYHWRVLRRDAGQAPEVPRQAAVRRIYAYLVAALGLIALLGGVVGLLTQLIDLLTLPAMVGLNFYREQVALYAAMTVVGAPVWLLPWRSMQKLAATDMQAAGLDERRSTVRKIYLYFFVFIASLAVFGSIGWFVYHILTALLGADLPDDFLTLVLNALVIGLVAAGVWLYHWAAIRRDSRLEQQTEAKRLANISVVVIDGGEGQLGRQLVSRFRQELPDVRLTPLGLTAQAEAAMDGQPFSVAALNSANFIIGSWQSLNSGQVAAAAATATATKIVAPLAESSWHWTGVSNQSADYHARQAVQGVKQALDGEEIRLGREFDAGTIIAIVVGVVLFLCVGSGLLTIIFG